MESAKLSPVVSSAPTLPMNSIWRTIRGYILWSYERGSLHYDVMVTLILLFVTTQQIVELFELSERNLMLSH